MATMERFAECDETAVAEDRSERPRSPTDDSRGSSRNGCACVAAHWRNDACGDASCADGTACSTCHSERYRGQRVTVSIHGGGFAWMG